MIFFINDHLEAKNVNSAFNENVNDIKIVRMDSPLMNRFNPIPAGGGGQFDPPCSFFYITQKLLA